MLAQLPPEIIIRSLNIFLPNRTPVQSRPYARCFGHAPIVGTSVFVEGGNMVSTSAELILFYPHLLQYPIHLVVWPTLHFDRPPVYLQEHGEIPTIPVHYLWDHLINMSRLTSLELHLLPSYYGAWLSTLEGLNARRDITLELGEKLQHDISMSENSLPVKCLTLPMDEPTTNWEATLAKMFAITIRTTTLPRRDISPWVPISPSPPRLLSAAEGG